MLILYLSFILLCLIPCGASQKDGVVCGPAPAWFESVDMSVDILKTGFHRELLYEVHHDPAPHVIKALVIQRLPSGVYMDQYQLASLREDTGLQVLLDSAVSLEDPAHLSSAFTALVYLSPSDGLPGLLQAVVPFHGRYHRPSSSGGWERVSIERPRLLLRVENCRCISGTPYIIKWLRARQNRSEWFGVQCAMVEKLARFTKINQHVNTQKTHAGDTLPSSVPHPVVEAPCTVQNQSLCSWLDIQGLQVPDSVTLELPVGDFSLMSPVCAGTILATLLCCAALFRTIWKHGMF
ncbi:hypothetical protein NFI96_016912 [Prochilodus magdalenae]|nr:hypothetical protein NFI96_016912 [Prochilodus magdalenae]